MSSCRLAAALLVLALAPHAAHADDPALAEAHRLEAQLEYEPALVIVEKLIAAGGANPEQLVERHLLAGKLAAGLDRVEVATAHFARVLALAPTTTLPAGTSPKLTEPFDAARALAPPLHVEVRTNTAAELIVHGDSLGLVVGIAATLADDRTITDPRATRIGIPPGARAVSVSALDDHGNVLWTGPATQPGIPEREPTPPPAPASTPLYRRWTVWAGTGTFALAVGGLAAWRFTVAQRDWDDLNAAGMTDYTRLRDIEDRGRRWGVVANVGFGVAAAAGIAAIICVATRTEEPRVVIRADATSVGLATGGSF